MLAQLICTAAGKCDPHQSGELPTEEKCPGLCDAPGCSQEVITDHYCAPHQVLVDAGAGPFELLEADKKANVYGVSLARLMFEGVVLLPMDPGA